MVICKLRASTVLSKCRTVRFFSLSCGLSRDKSVIYNSSKRPDIVFSEEFRQKIRNGYKHPRNSPIFEPSQEMTQNILKVFDKPLATQKDQIPRFVAAGDKLEKFIKHRHVPLEKSEVSARKKNIEEMIKQEFNIDHIDRENEPDKVVMKKLKSLENAKMCKWTPIEFDEIGSLTYLLSRTAVEFAALKYVFEQISGKDPSFQPKTLFDFGSGVASGLWAVKDTFGHVSEAYLVDPSKHMNDLARMILGGGDAFHVPSGISFRLHTPSSSSLQYDLVLCSYTMLELPSAVERLSCLHTLWEKVEYGGYLVLVETGTNAGFHVIAEARDYLNQLSRLPDGDAGPPVGHAVAPCPHDDACPRHSEDTVPCNFPIRYRNFALPGISTEKIKTENISYVAFKKDVREVSSQPRLVETPVRAGSCIYCRLCTGAGTLQEVLVRKKDDAELYQLAKRLKCGDELPVRLKEWVDKPKIGTPWMKKMHSSQKP